MLANSRTFKNSTQYFIAIAIVLLVSTACFFSTSILGYKTVALILLMTVSILAMLFDILPVLSAAVLSAVIWNFFFIPPIFTFHIDTTEDLLMFLLYFAIAMVNAVLTFKIRKEESKTRDKEEKEKTIKLYDTLLNSLSHELRTPISTILGAVDTIKENKDKLSATNQHELLNQIDEASMRLNRQVDNLLNMSRLQTGMLKPKLDWCDVNELIFSVIHKSSPTSHQIIRFQPIEELPFFKLDRGLIEQVLQNLIYNALNYAGDNIIIDISARQQAENCTIEISDNGKGIPGHEMPYVFDKFYRLPHSKPGGSGLGLSIVKGFVEAHNGRASISRSSEGGAKFTLVIPAEASYLNNLKNE